MIDVSVFSFAVKLRQLISITMLTFPFFIVYTVVTFPFLFAVMFGDWGHGICLLLAALYLMIRERKFTSQKLGDIMEIAFGGRYIIMMMALFSVPFGLLYS